jgi:hypothetical protein
MKKINYKFTASLLIGIIFLILDSGYAQLGFSPKIDSVINLVTLQSVRKLDRELSGDTVTTIGGTPYTIVSRHYNSASNPKAAQYIYEKFTSFGITARYMNNSSTSVNVIGRKTGTKYPNQQFIICAHYDDMPSGAIAPGADDNASGTVGVIEAARLLANYSMQYTVLFIAFDEEERGLYGSYAYVDSAFAHGDSIVGVINLDMIAYDGNNDGKMNVVTNNASLPLAQEYISTILTYTPTIVPIQSISTTANSDHAAFWTHNYLAFMAIEDNSEFNPNYHTVNDNFANVNLSYMQQLVRSAVAYLISKANNLKINITHTPLPSGNYTGNRIATAVIKSPRGLGKLSNAPRLYYAVNNGNYTYLNASYQNLDTFKFTIPGQPIGNSVNYYIAAQDSLAELVVTLPSGGRGINPPGFIDPPTFFTYEIGNIVQACIGTGTTTTGYPFYTYYMDSRTDMIYTASEISSAGGVPGALIQKIGFNVVSAAAQPMNGFQIKIQHTTNNSITGFTSTGWNTVFSGVYSVPGTGQQYITLQSPFVWNGSNNLLIEICFNNSSWTSNTTVSAFSAPGHIIHNHQDLSSGDGCVDITTVGTGNTSKPVLCIEFNTSPNGIENLENTPKVYSLSQNFPNPFNPMTRITYAIPKSGFVKIAVYDILGREVASLVNDELQIGVYEIDFNGENLSSGVYYYKMTAGNFTSIKKMVLIK